ncbi:MAG TPA: TIGR00725 family protein [Kofleriaceae bacterium]|nr:TIGR00725 family protein [Kofleriaceae bacterium]
MTTTRRPLAVVIGSARAHAATLGEASEVGRALVDIGFRVATGGLGGVMDAALQGARTSTRYHQGDTVAFLPGYGDAGASPAADIVLRTGLQHARNVVMIASADVVLAIGGRAGTLTEMALAWELSRPIVAVGTSAGWAMELAGRALDDRRTDMVHGPLPPREAAQLAKELIGSLGSSREYT